MMSCASAFGAMTCGPRASAVRTTSATSQPGAVSGETRLVILARSAKSPCCRRALRSPRRDGEGRRPPFDWAVRFLAVQRGRVLRVLALCPPERSRRSGGRDPNPIYGV